MGHERFQLNYPEGSIEVQFNLEYTTDLFVDQIHIHSTKLDIQLPRHPKLVAHMANGYYVPIYKSEEAGGLVSKFEYATDKYSKDIVEKILEINEDRRPIFGLSEPG